MAENKNPRAIIPKKGEDLLMNFKTQCIPFALLCIIYTFDISELNKKEVTCQNELNESER